MKKLLIITALLVISSLACGLASRTAAPAADAPEAGFSSPTTAPTSAAPAGSAETPASADNSQPAAEETQPAAEETRPAAEAPTGTPDAVAASGSAPFPLVPPVDVNQNGKIDICEAIFRDTIQVLMARSLVSDPQPFQDPAMGDGCAYDFGKDSHAAYFAYVAVGTEKMFTDALANAVRAEPVTTLGDSAFLNYGPDARQLWIRKGSKSILIAIGDEERVDVMMVFGYYLLDYIQR